MSKKPGLIIITGPTAVGKTEISIELAKAVSGEIISADSIQVYKHMDIGSAKITADEMQGVRHHLIDILEPTECFDVATFKDLANKAINEIYQRGNIPIIVGGTGFYIQAVLNNIDFTENENDGYRDELTRLHEEKGAQYLHDMLQREDPAAAAAIHPNNVKRVIRALEYKHQTGSLISLHNEEERQKSSTYNHAYFVLNCDRQTLYDRIDKRIDLMLEQGLVDEVKYLMEDCGVTRAMTAMQGLGYKEIYDYLKGEYTLEDAVYILKRDTRHFAKRQLTWFRRESDVIWVDKDELKDKQAQLSYMLGILKERAII